MEAIVILISLVGAAWLTKLRMDMYYAVQENARLKKEVERPDLSPEIFGWKPTKHDCWQKGTHRLVLVREGNVYVFIAGNGYIEKFRNERGALEDISRIIKNIKANTGLD